MTLLTQSNLSPDERERIAYIQGRPMLAELFAEHGAAEALAEDQSDVRSIVQSMSESLAQLIDDVRAIRMLSLDDLPGELERIAGELETADKNAQRAVGIIDGEAE